MKCITIKQPCGSLICEGIKDVENRTWKTNIRGRVLIHAASQSWLLNRVLNYMTIERWNVFEKFGFTGTWLRNLPTGKIIGSVEIVDCVINCDSIWAEKSDEFMLQGGKPTYNWVLANPILFDKPIPAKGKLSFWEFDMEGKI